MTTETVEQTTTKTTFVCPGCGWEYSLARNLEKHMTTIHSGLLEARSEVEVKLESKAAKPKPPKGSRPCGGGCGLNVIEKDVTYGDKTYTVLVHTGFTPEQYSIVERCMAR